MASHGEGGRIPGDQRAVPFREALRVWARVALLSFGGPAGQIAVMHRILVEEKRWIGERRFLHALNYCMLLPGPEAQQLATYVGWLLHGTKGGLVAGGLFVLPGFASILLLSVLYVSFEDRAAVDALFYGLKAAVLAVVVEAVLRIGRRALKGPLRPGIAVAAFVAIFVFEVPFPAIVLAAALIGTAAGRWLPAAFAGAAIGEERAERAAPAAIPGLGRALRVGGAWLALWLAPVWVLHATLGADSVFVEEGLFFSKAAVVTFGGAYAVLAYIAQKAVETYGWLQPGEMLDGLGMAESTPGPLIQVVQFVGFLGAYRQPGSLDPLTAGILGSFLVTWVTFVPCFLWIFLGAPYVERLRSNRALADALAGITAAVVGVIGNLAIWFALHTLFGRVGESRTGAARLLVPDWETLDPAAAFIALAALVAMLRFRAGMLPTLAGSAIAGGAWYLAAR